MHDPLCPRAHSARYPTKKGCGYCDLIARVRTDQDSLIRVSKIVREQTFKAYSNGYERGRLDERAGNPHLSEA